MTRVAVLSGGVGGAKLVLGASRLVPGDALAVIANVGDDFDHLGLRICPDLDTLMYTLAGEVDTRTGWGRRDESYRVLETVAALGGPDWFRLGDRDLATHLVRTAALAAGDDLATITAGLCARFGVTARLLPASLDRVRTRVATDAGLLDFQPWFVGRRAEPAVRSLRYDGADTACPAPPVLAALADPALEAIIVAPSNPWLSIDPILAIPGLRAALAAAPAPVVAVAPIVAGRALKGPTAKLMAELGIRVSAASVARHYRGLIDGFILDREDRALVPEIVALDVAVRVCNTVMNTLDDKLALAREALAFAAALGSGSR